MILRRLLAATVLAACLAPASARASTTSCQGATDGTPCTAACFSGTCLKNVCLKTTLRPNGTPCSTENLCTSDDVCQSGVCVAGPTVTCPDKSACEVGVCDTRTGCGFKDICPDLAVVDLAGPDGGADLGVPDQGSGQDLSLIPPNDMCVIPPGSEFFQCTGADGFYYLPLDAALRPGDAGAPFHVRGSRIGDCSFGGSGAEPLGLGLFLGLLLAAAALTRKTA